MDQKVLEVIGKGLGLEGEAATSDAVRAKLSEMGVPDGALFTQDDVNAFLAKDKRGAHKQAEELQRRLDAQSEALEQQTQHMADILAKLNGGASATDGGAGGEPSGQAGKSDDSGAAVVGVEKRLEARLKQVQEALERTSRQVQEERKKREEAEQSALDKERDNVLISAARKAGMIDPERNAPLYFRDRLRKDEKGGWTFVTDDELPADSIEEGIGTVLVKQLPYLREPKVAGGAGSGGPGAPNPIKQAEEVLKKIDEAAKLQPKNDHLQVQLIRAQREVAALKAGRK